jgi:hypothetical protein
MGDSAGSNIVAQTALAISDPAYAERVGLATRAACDRPQGSASYGVTVAVNDLPIFGDDAGDAVRIIGSHGGAEPPLSPRGTGFANESLRAGPATVPARSAAAKIRTRMLTDLFSLAGS